MSTITFDTDRLVEDLKASGIEHNQARAIVRGLVEAQAKAATQDLMQRIEQRLVIKLGAISAFAIGIVVVLVKLL